MSVLRPKYQLDHAEVQGDRITIPPKAFTTLTTRHYPYPRVGTRAPDGMFPTGNPGNPGNPLVRASYGYVRDGSIVRAISGLQPHYMLDKAVVQGVMPASTYRGLTGKITTAPQLPSVPRAGVTRARAPALAFDWGSLFIGAVGGVVFTLGMVYGVIPALAEWTRAEIKKRY